MWLVVLGGGAVAYLALAAWVVALCRMAGCADREARIAEGRADPELESLGGFAVSTAGVAEPLEWRLEAAFSGLYRARVP